MVVVHMMRGAAPDKFSMWTDRSYKMINHDFTNLVDYTEDEVKALADKGEYIISADEGDIRHANSFKESYKSIILPRNSEGNIIDYDEFIPKNSRLYQSLQYDPIFKYAPFEIVSISKLKQLVHYGDQGIDVAIKTCTGSGSRGVVLVTEDPEKLKLGGKYVSPAELEDSSIYSDFLKFVEKENCEIMIQELIPFREHDLRKVNVDFVIRNGRLLGYKWTETDPSAVFTNWNWGYHVNTGYTDHIMQHVAKVLRDNGVTDALMNFEAFSNYETETWLVEFNWRYSNSTFEGQAAAVDLISCYLHGDRFEMPRGRHKFARYWQCGYYDDNRHLVVGK